MNSGLLSQENNYRQGNEGEYYLNQNRLTVLGRLIPIIVHEVNNPIQAISGAASLAMEEIGDENEVASYLTLIQNESRRVLALTTFIRSLYLPSKNQKQQINLIECLQGLMPVLKDDFHRHGINFFFEPLQTPIMIQGDLVEIQLALIETILNLNSWLHDRNYRQYQIKIFTEQKKAVIEFVADVGTLEDFPFNFPTMEQWVSKQGGRIFALVVENLSVLRFEFPSLTRVRS